LQHGRQQQYRQTGDGPGRGSKNRVPISRFHSDSDLQTRRPESPKQPILIAWKRLTSPELAAKRKEK
jgi:hypothetical protein